MPRRPRYSAPTRKENNRKAAACSPLSRRLRWNPRSARSRPGSTPRRPSSSTRCRCLGTDYASARPPAAPPSMSARAWRSTGSRSKVRSTRSGRPSATAGSSARCRSSHGPEAKPYPRDATRSGAKAAICRACISTSRRRNVNRSSKRCSRPTRPRTPVASSRTSCRAPSVAT